MARGRGEERGVRMDIAGGVDENQCDIKILEMAVRFVNLADSWLGNTVHNVQNSYRITPFVISGRLDKCRPLVV